MPQVWHLIFNEFLFYRESDKNCPWPPFCSLSRSWSHPLQSKAHCPLSPATSLCPSLALAFSQMLLKARPARSCCAIFSRPASLLTKLLDMRNLSWASFVCSVRRFPSRKDVELWLSLHLLRWPYGFILHSVGFHIYTLVYVEPHISDQYEWSFQCAVEFGLLVFCWEFLSVAETVFSALYVLGTLYHL
jgi:hypothetical protein